MDHQSNSMMQMLHRNDQEIARLQEALAHAQQEREALFNQHETLVTQHTALSGELQVVHGELQVVHGELRIARTERDLLKEQLAAFTRRLFTAKSEARGSEQKDLFLNEAEALAGTQTADAEDAASTAAAVDANQTSPAQTPGRLLEVAREAYGEQRINLLGWLDGSIVHLTYTERGDDMHIISLRKAEKHEIRRYAKEVSG